MAYLIHGANVLYLLSYLVRDILWLRILTVCAGVSLIPYFYFQDPPLLPAVIWNLVFVSINVIQIRILLLERMPVRMSEREQRLYRMVFRHLAPREFMKILAFGKWHEAAPSKKLIEQDSNLDRLMVIYSGRVSVESHGRQIAELSDGAFIGELSFIKKEKTSATVITTCPTAYVAWQRKPLEKFLETHPEMNAAWQLIIGTDLATKLTARA